MDVAEEDDHDQLPVTKTKTKKPTFNDARWQPLNSFNTCQVASIKFKFNSHRLTAVKQLAETNPRACARGTWQGLESLLIQGSEGFNAD